MLLVHESKICQFSVDRKTSRMRYDLTLMVEIYQNVGNPKKKSDLIFLEIMFSVSLTKFPRSNLNRILNVVSLTTSSGVDPFRQLLWMFDIFVSATCCQLRCISTMRMKYASSVYSCCVGYVSCIFGKSANQIVYNSKLHDRTKYKESTGHHPHVDSFCWWFWW